MRILVCGGRDYAYPSFGGDWKKEYKFIHDTLERLARKYSKEVREDLWLPTDITIIEGGSRGADTAASDWATCSYAKNIRFPADWDKYGIRAGFIRNKQMLDEGKPDLVVAFPGGRGTAHMVRLAKEYGVEVLEIEGP